MQHFNGIHLKSKRFTTSDAENLLYAKATFMKVNFKEELKGIKLKAGELVKWVSLPVNQR